MMFGDPCEETWKSSFCHNDADLRTEQDSAPLLLYLLLAKITLINLGSFFILISYKP
jgi:hypothetical protein